MDPLQLKVFIWMYFNGIKSQENVTYSDVSWTFSDNVLGTLNLTDIRVTGWQTLTNEVYNMEATQDAEGNNEICVLFPADYLELTLNYDADIGIDDEIPIYGEGQLLYRMENIAYNACLFLNLKESYIDNVAVKLLYRHTPLELTGFWRNNEVSIILTRLLNFASRFIAMWNNYEPERTSCLWSPFLSYALNLRIENENASLDFDPLCFKKIFFDEDDNSEAEVEELVLRKMLKAQESDVNSDKLHHVTEEDKQIILPIIKHLTQLGKRLF